MNSSELYDTLVSLDEKYTEEAETFLFTNKGDFTKNAQCKGIKTNRLTGVAVSIAIIPLLAAITVFSVVIIKNNTRKKSETTKAADVETIGNTGTFIVNNPDVSAYSDDVSVWDFVPEERICKVSELRNSSDYLMNPELTVIKNGSIGESKLAFFTDQEKMRANQILNIDSLRFDDDETKIRYIKKLSDFCNAPGPDFFVDKMVLPFLSLDFRIAGSTTLSSYTIGDLFESYDNIEKDCLYIVFDNDDCFIFNYYRQKDGSHILLPWESQPGQSPLESDSASIIQNIAQYRDMIWYYKEIQQQLNSTITRVLYAESGLKDTVIMYMTDKGAMAQLINGDNYVLLSENELKEIYSEYVANRDLQPGLQYGTGNRRQITKEYTQKSRITIGVISAAAVLCTAIVVMFLYKNHTRKAKLAQKSFSE